MKEAATSPHFENAPVVEMMIGSFFAPVSGWDLLDFGLLWQKFVPRYSRHEFKLPIGDPNQLQTQVMASVKQQDIGTFPVRCWFIDQSEAELVQVQDTCLIHNWRKIAEPPAYRGYENIRRNFAADWRTFHSFLQERNLAPPDMWKCELTYINQFVRGAEWKSFADLSKIYRLWRGMESEGALSTLEFASFAANYALPNSTTRLLFASQPAIRTNDGKEVIQLTITATGKPSGSSEEDVLGWLNDAHEAVVDGFLRFTTPEVQEYWRPAK